MKLPLKPDPDTLAVPAESVCVVCGGKIGETEGFIRLTAGAILHCDEKRDCGGPSDLMETLLSLWYHGPHPITGTTDDDRPIISMDNEEFHLDIVERGPGGQVDIHFCSSPCLSKFLADVVEQFEAGIEKTTKPNNTSQYLP